MIKRWGLLLGVLVSCCTFAAEHGVNRMELSPDNPKDGSDKFYKAIVEFARQ